MSDLSNQLQDYMEHVVERFDVDSLPVRLAPEEGLRLNEPARWSNRPAWVVAIATAIIVLLIVGGSNVLFNALRSTPPADEIPTTTEAPIDEPSPTTTEVVAAPTTIEQVEVDVASSVVPGLGTLRWELFEGDESSLPININGSPDGGYVSYEGGRTWRSTDAVTWVVDESAAALVGYEWVEQSADWAIGFREDGQDLFQRTGEGWVYVELSEPAFPEVAGMRWESRMQFPVEVGERRVVGVTATGQVTWSDAFGAFEVDCGQPQLCEMEPWVEWSEATQTFRISAPDDGSELAVVAAQVDGDDIVFSDSVTGETVHTISTTSEYPPAAIINSLQRGPGPGYAGGWVGADGEDWSWVPFPWETQAEILEVPAGGLVVYDFVFEWQSSTPLITATVLTSLNGIDWSSQGLPGFPVDEAQYVRVESLGGTLQAMVITGYDESTSSEIASLWSSIDGVEWQPIASDFPAWSREFETDFGLVVNAMPQSTSLFWVSTDGSTWHEVLGPPGSHEPAGAGYAAVGALDDFIWMTVGEDGGARRLWIGRFG